MNAKELFISDGAPAGIWFCSQCRNVAGTQSQAEECCKKHLCRICGKPVIEPHWMVHRDCAEKERVEKAEKLEAWGGWVYLEGIGSEYFPSVEDLLDVLEDDGEETPEFAFICKPIQFHAPSAERIIEWACEDHYDEASERIKGEAPLSRALQEFERKNRHIVSYEPDYKRMVRLK